MVPLAQCEPYAIISVVGYLFPPRSGQVAVVLYLVGEQCELLLPPLKHEFWNGLSALSALSALISIILAFPRANYIE